MIKLKITSKEMSEFSSILQRSIEIARDEINNGHDLVLYKNENGTLFRKEAWNKDERDKNTLKIAERNGHISEFEAMQRKLLIKYDSKHTSKEKAVSISLMNGYCFLIYMTRAENLIKDGFASMLISKLANVILRELI